MQREYDFSPKFDDHIWVCINANVSNNRFDGYAFAKYAGLVRVRGRGRVFYGGHCYVKATETPFAYAIKDAIKICYGLFQTEQRLRIWTRNSAVRRYVNDFAPKWESKFGRNSRHKIPEGRSEWIDASQYKIKFGIFVEQISGHDLKYDFSLLAPHIAICEASLEHPVGEMAVISKTIYRWTDRNKLDEVALSAV